MSVAIGQEDGAELSRGVAIETHVGKLHKYKMYLISYVLVHQLLNVTHYNKLENNYDKNKFTENICMFA